MRGIGAWVCRLCGYWSETLGRHLDHVEEHGICCDWETMYSTDDGVVLYPDICDCICHVPEDD